MTETEENAVRNVLARMREEDPRAFLRLVFDAVTAKMKDDSISVLSRTNTETNEPDLAVVLFLGEKPAKWAIESIAELHKKTQE